MSILARLGGEKELDFLLKKFEECKDDDAKNSYMELIAYTKQPRGIEAILKEYDVSSEGRKEYINKKYLSKCILELPKDTKTGKYDIKTVDKWLKKHRKDYKINKNSIQ